MVEGKPPHRQHLDVPVTDPYFADYWACVEELGLPIIWHVNDPEEFLGPGAHPEWAAERNWGYGPEDVQKEKLYAEVDEVLTRHPRLKIIFAHFYFLSADLPRAARFLDAYPSVCFDLAPGVEMLYNISRDPDAGREFFVRTPTASASAPTCPAATPARKPSLGPASRSAGWKAPTSSARRSADFLLGPPEDGIIRGMALPDDVLARIYGGNLMRLAGATPKPLDAAACGACCADLDRIAAQLSGERKDTQAAKVARKLTAA